MNHFVCREKKRKTLTAAATSMGVLAASISAYYLGAVAVGGK
ncbi:MAG: hypothetical protein ACLRK9_13195 [Roseburia hominis]